MEGRQGKRKGSKVPPRHLFNFSVTMVSSGAGAADRRSLALIKLSQHGCEQFLEAAQSSHSVTRSTLRSFPPVCRRYTTDIT